MPFLSEKTEYDILTEEFSDEISLSDIDTKLPSMTEAFLGFGKKKIDTKRIKPFSNFDKNPEMAARDLVNRLRQQDPNVDIGTTLSAINDVYPGGSGNSVFSYLDSDQGKRFFATSKRK
jgi:hypothetical protein